MVIKALILPSLFLQHLFSLPISSWIVVTVKWFHTGMINDIKLDDAVENLALWRLEQPPTILSKFITIAVRKQCELHYIYVSLYIYIHTCHWIHITIIHASHTVRKTIISVIMLYVDLEQNFLQMNKWFYFKPLCVLGEGKERIWHPFCCWITIISPGYLI